jgi:hypothetical protein
MRKIRRKDPRPKPLKRQRDVLCDVMLSAGACETADAGGAVTGDALRGSNHLRAVAPFAETAIRRVRGEEAPAGSRGGFVRRGARAGVGIPAESRGAGGCDLSDGAEG